MSEAATAVLLGEWHLEIILEQTLERETGVKDVAPERMERLCRPFPLEYAPFFSSSSVFISLHI